MTQPANASLSFPERQLGMVAPLLVNCEIAYQFYCMQAATGLPWNVALAEAGIDLQAFSRAALEEADNLRLEKAIAGLVHKGAELLVLGGVPVVALKGFEYWNHRLQGLAAAYDRPVISDFECAVEGLKALGARNVAVANKWDETINRQLVADLERFDLNVAGVGAEPHTAEQVSGLGPAAGIDSCRRVCRRALESSRQPPDALFLAGGAWYSTLATADLEAEFGVPIVTNPGAAMWYGLNRLGSYAPAPALGQLYGRILADAEEPTA